MERRLKCRSKNPAEQVKKDILNRLRSNPRIDAVWKEQEYLEVVIHGVTVPRGYTVPSLGAELRAALEKLNSGKLSLRNPVFLAAPMTKIDKASLRVLLLSPDTTILKAPTLEAPTPEGIQDL